MAQQDSDQPAEEFHRDRREHGGAQHSASTTIAWPG
jgi:hypothetical protein